MSDLLSQVPVLGGDVNDHQWRRLIELLLKSEGLWAHVTDDHRATSQPAPGSSEEAAWWKDDARAQFILEARISPNLRNYYDPKSAHKKTNLKSARDTWRYIMKNWGYRFN